jgi:hypothetical protein
MIEFQTKRHPFIVSVAEITSDFFHRECYLLIVECPSCKTKTKIKIDRDFMMGSDDIREKANQLMEAHVNAIDFPAENYVA